MSKKQSHKNRVHLVHRIDKDASGLLVFARREDALNNLKKQFFEHTITRRYDVVVHGVPRKPTGRLEHHLSEDQRGMVHVTKDHVRGKDAILDYELVAAGETAAHLRCTLYTGRKHQIRVQLKEIGHTVCGDPIAYGNAGRAAASIGLARHAPDIQTSRHA